MKKTTAAKSAAYHELAKRIHATVVDYAEKNRDLAMPDCIDALAHVLAATIGAAANSEQSVSNLCAATAAKIENTARYSHSRLNPAKP